MSRETLEKRVSKRYPPSVYISVFDAGTKKFFGLMADLSKTGFKLSSQEAISVNQPYHLAIRNPFGGKESPLNPFVVKAQWSKKQGDGFYETGFEFVDLEKESEALFVRLNEDFETAANFLSNMDK